MFRSAFVQRVFLFAIILLLITAVTAAQELPPAGPPSGGDFSQAPVVAVPPGEIVVRGAEPRASDHTTPLPEDGHFARNVYQNRYFGLTFRLPAGWSESFSGPPPSSNGAYVLANALGSNSGASPGKGTLLISAQDMFFTPLPVQNARDLIEYDREHLPSYYEVERKPEELSIAGRRFVRFDYGSPVAQLHWTILTTELRCHSVQFVLTSRDASLIEEAVRGLASMTIVPDQGTGSEAPLCKRDYAAGSNLITRVDPALTDKRVAAIPVRLIIDRRGRVRHVHVLRAFPEQAEKIVAAVMQWQFKPFERNGEAAEVETGIMFGSRASLPAPKPSGSVARSAE